jgi:hypothetical protein
MKMRPKPRARSSATKAQLGAKAIVTADPALALARLAVELDDFGDAGSAASTSAARHDGRAITLTLPPSH